MSIVCCDGHTPEEQSGRQAFGSGSIISRYPCSGLEATTSFDINAEQNSIWHTIQYSSKIQHTSTIMFTTKFSDLVLGSSII
jgi:hypothetical protein